MAASSFVCSEDAATCEEDGQQEEGQESVDNDDDDGDDSGMHQNFFMIERTTSAEGD